MHNCIRVLRKQKGISQETLAKACGVTRQTVNAIENNKYDPTLALAFALARELDTTVDELFAQDGNTG
ncbi:helix-turn-helix transcriptional regulator [uncultured Gemmiger sp.]|uniref:helix-turn-helix transcriptional regulator n=1 Tax=uncultured Gemmiger sp. TaxID=1623490 RepID=UPI0025D704AB|nr:helix-turn-helix transcriptional regulator [uncultured Gemmiger sp.]